MPELPDVLILACSLDQALRGRRITAVNIYQPKCLNRPEGEFRQAVVGRAFQHAWQRGKWVLADLDRDWTLAFNLGMGGELRLHDPDEIPDPRRERVVFHLDDGTGLWVHFWWFGHVHLIPLGDLTAHPILARLGPEPLADDFTPQRLERMLQGKRGPIKKYLLDQRFIAGIGNVYVQDILWYARLHPLRPANTLEPADVKRLHQGIRRVLEEGIRWGGGPREYDVWGNEGHYVEHLQVGYRTGEPCPACGTTIETLRVGSTTSYICPRCQI
ncbi:MAG: bifunctional DNA-formamidopyrimidine glycosylase/DNA-(apurinic or apyrimidinic site) lyase [Chloroflexi bacterium]|nr:bifunctional DNA-formamidopyrimidine glycosylase/DNA-(apurinic or apyrimidinic site) lyase [Chloroflexota bacterium]